MAQMKIATWNLESINRLTPRREDEFHRTMKKIEADVWVLTETWTDFKPLPGYELVAQSSEARDLNPERRWVSIWARSSLTYEQRTIQRQPDRMACCRIEQPGQRDMVVVGTVLPWPSDKLWPGATGFCNALADQASDWRRLQETNDTSSFLVAGDFNQAIPYQPWYGSKQAAKALQVQDLVCLTPGNDPLTGKPRIDHFCVKSDGPRTPVLRHVDTWEIPLLAGKPITDHSGVYIDLDVG
jgi:exonuclease III